MRFGGLSVRSFGLSPSSSPLEPREAARERGAGWGRGPRSAGGALRALHAERGRWGEDRAAAAPRSEGEERADLTLINPKFWF